MSRTWHRGPSGADLRGGPRRDRSPVSTSTAPTRSGNAHAATWRWVILLALVFAAYAPSQHAEFVNWDDPIHVYENPRVTSPDALRHAWTDGTKPGFYPVLYGIYRLEWLAGGGKAWLFHVDNVLLHAVNMLLVGLLARALAMGPLAAWLVAGVWALHPVHVESVAWVTERKNVLYVLFWLGSLLLYLRSRRPGSGAALAYAASLVLFVLSLLSKAAAMTLPAAFVLAEWARGRRLDGRFWLSLVPYIVLGVLGGIELVQLVPATLDVPPLESRLRVACRALWFYLAKFLWPHPLVPVYPTWSIAHLDVPDVLAALGVVGLAVAAVALRARVPRVMVFAAGFFVTNIALVLGVVWNSYQGYAFVADRYLYLPAVGLSLLAVGALGGLRRITGLPAGAATILATAWLALLAVATSRQAAVWNDSDRLWTYTLAYNPDCAVCHENLALVLMDRGDLAAAEKHYEEALRLDIDPQGALAFGSLRLQQGRLDEAAALYELAGRLDPHSPKVPYNLGIVREGQGDLEGAIARYRDAVRLEPEWPDAHNNLGVTLFKTGRVEEAKREFEATLRLHPGDIEAELNLGRIAVEGEDWEEAGRHYRAAAAAATETRQSIVAHTGLAAALVNQGKFSEAIEHYRAALRLDPGDVDVLGVLAWILATNPDAQWRDGAEAVRLAERACALTENRDADALDTLAVAYAEAGRFEDAVRAAHQALDRPDVPSGLADQIRARLALYQAGQAYRAP